MEKDLYELIGYVKALDEIRFNVLNQSRQETCDKIERELIRVLGKNWMGNLKIIEDKNYCVQPVKTLIDLSLNKY